MDTDSLMKSGKSTESLMLLGKIYRIFEQIRRGANPARSKSGAEQIRRGANPARSKSGAEQIRRGAKIERP
ncbi:hypothetical protein [Lancefieldella parvula]|uniref:hypothetical protein n=1 Tax=Lancefieldella parvula TaxID=1382 RepID=UPI00165349B5|nr:hypothetical protein [Lancefieldella parvula]